MNAILTTAKIFVVLSTASIYQQPQYQCFTIKEMQGIFSRNSDSREKYLSNKGYELTSGLGGNGKSYIFSKNKKSIIITTDSTEKVCEVSYECPSLECFDSIKFNAGLSGFKKEKEYFKADGIIYFYSNGVSGLEIYRASAESHFRIGYFVTIMHKDWYKREMIRVSNLN